MMMDPTTHNHPRHHHNEPPTASSQASSHFPLDPVSGAVLFEQEARRRDRHTNNTQMGSALLATGCRELDVEVLCGGGFERGCVVGVSAEEEEVGLVMALQTLARGYVVAAAGKKKEEGSGAPRGLVITTLSMGALLPLLRDVFWGQVDAVGGKEEEDKAGLLKGFLERVEVARVFDIPGLWEVLGDLDGLVDGDEGAVPGDSPRSKGDGEEGAHESNLGEAVPQQQRPASEEIVETEGTRRTHELLLSSSPLSDPPSSLPDEPAWEEITTDAGPEELPRKTPPGRRVEIQDSEDEGEGGSSPLSSTGGATVLSAGQPPEDGPDHHRPEDVSRQAATPAAEPPEATTTTAEPTKRPSSGGKNPSKRPDIIIITHMSTLLSTLFQQREKSAAHQTLQLLSSHIRYLTRAPEHGGPLVMLLNSTTSSFPSPDNNTNNTSNPTGGAGTDRPPPPAAAADHHHPSLPPPTKKAKGASAHNNKPLDPTLRSIFNPPPLPASGLSYAYDTPHARRNKPSFGLIFTQMLDMHLLCTRLPKTRDDAEALYAPPPLLGAAETEMGGTRPVAYGWVVEVLLDEMGVWEGRDAVVEGGGSGRRRERRSREQRWGAVDVVRRRRDGKGIVVANLFGRRDRSGGEVVVAGGFGGRRV